MKKNKMGIAVLLIIAYFLLGYVFSINFSIENYQAIGAIAISAVILATTFFVVNNYKKEKKINYKKIILSIIAIGLIVRTVYILYTPITERQHDVTDNFGHLEYIETIYETGKLPDTNTWQFYHQPLHHYIAAGWLKINNIFGVDLETSEEGIQFLTAIYSSAIMLITYCILKELNIKDKYKTAVMLIVAVHPTFIILAGSINNDILMIMFMMWTILYLIKWYKNPNYKNTIIMALLTAGTALTKISGTIIAIPMIYIFIDKFMRDYLKEKDKKIIKSYILKFVVFGVIALGLGLSYSIRNMIKFNQSIFYVPTPGSSLYCGDSSIFARFNIFSQEWKDIYAHPYEDCNMIVFLIKSSLFGEFYTEEFVSNILAVGMLVLNIVIIVISLICLIRMLTRKQRNNPIIENMLAIFYIAQLGVYLYGNLTMPYGCTMDIRYIVPTIILGMLFIVINISQEKKDYSKFVNIAVILFAIISVIFELTYMQTLYI